MQNTVPCVPPLMFEVFWTLAFGLALNLAFGLRGCTDSARQRALIRGAFLPLAESLVLPRERELSEEARTTESVWKISSAQAPEKPA